MATIGSEFTVRSRNRLKSAGDPKKDWTYMVSVEMQSMIDAVGSVKMTQYGLDQYTDISEELLVRAQTVKIPKKSVNEITAKFLGMEQVFAGKMAHDHTLSLTFLEFEDEFMLKLMNAMADRVGDYETGMMGTASKLGSNGYAIPTLTIYQYKGNGAQLAFKHEFYNVWLKEFAEISLGYESTNQIKYTATFMFDTWKCVGTGADQVNDAGVTVKPDSYTKPLGNGTLKLGTPQTVQPGGATTGPSAG